jgi:hypothetical protein
MEQLGSLWPGLEIPEKLDALTRIANQALAARGIPNVHVVMSRGELAAGTGAHFDFKTWSVVLDANVVKAKQLDARTTEYIGALGRHEVDHTRQWWEMARYRAGEGDSAQAIHDRTEIDLDVAIQAVEIAKRDGPLSPAARARAEEYWHSVYGDHRKARKWTLDERAELSKRRNELKEKIDKFEELSGKELAKLLEEKGEADELFEAVDFMYKSLPEEAPSFEIEGIVKAESALMEVEREFEFAEIAARHAEDVLDGVENRLLNEIAHDRHPSAELQADQARLLMRLQNLHTKVEQLRTRRAQLEAWVQGGAAP